MKINVKAVNFLTLIIILTLCSSCTGQNSTRAKSSFSQTQNESSTSDNDASELKKRFRVIFQDKKGNYWFVGDKGVYKYNKSTQQEKEKGLVFYSMKDGLCHNGIVGIQEDELGNVYFDAQGCVSKYDGQRFTTLEIIDNENTRKDWKLEPGDLWFRLGWEKSGPYRYDGKALYHLEFPKSDMEDAFYAEYPNASFNPYGIYSMYTDSKGSVWFGTASFGLCRYDGQSVSWLYEEQLSKTTNGGDFGIRSIIEDDKGYFWICNSRYRFDILPKPSENNGISLLNYKRKKGIGITHGNDTEFLFYMSIAKDSYGDLWMATYDEGVWRYDGNQLIHYPVKEGSNNVLIFSIYRDNDDVLWLASESDGIYKYNGRSFEKFTL